MATRGLSILVVGPDGTGKSTLADGLETCLSRDREIVRIHHRRPVLPRRGVASAVPLTKPHASKAYGPVASITKILYLFLDVQLDWHMRTRRALRQGSWVLAERGWWDIAVDPLRYRLSCGRRFVEALGRFVPRPDVVAILEAPGQDVFARKPELTPEEIDRQAAAWRRIAVRGAHLMSLDANLPPAELVEQVVAAITTGAPAQMDRWVGLPSRRNPRWLIPAAPLRATSASLSLYQPLTRRAQLGWRIVRVAARTGGLRLLSGAIPPPAVVDQLREYVPAGGRVAISASRHPSRATALLMDRDGRPVYVVKLARDKDGTARLGFEALALRRWGTGLPSPLRAPGVVACEPGLLVLEYLRPVRRREPPWSLPIDAAEALGSASRRLAPEGGWFCHGDVAPWNLFPTSGGWALVDWEAASDLATPFQDVVHFIVQSATLLGRPSIAEVAEGVRGRGRLAPTFEAFARGSGLALSDVPEAALMYTRRTMVQLDARSDDGRRGIRGRRALLVALRSGT